ncbi:MAG: putative methyltransferase [Anaerolineaceae bacterium]|nr:MAG: putative methyltransferase [Anaerolineaceae bacterium]HRQ31562.1 class I SAM-dependent methyltransferase [Anaerolineales bacterium]
MSIDETQRKLGEYFVGKLEEFGATPKGVDYNGIESQVLRFEQLAKVIDPSKAFSVIDYGSGYGGLFDFLHSKGWRFEYYGIDLLEGMVLAGRETHKNFPNARFTTDEREVPIADYVLASGIFNVRLEESYSDWQDFTCETLKRIDALCSKGFSFNLLTKYSDADHMAQRPELFYGDPLFFFDFCKRNFSRNVALLHDYEIYDFTILVRK